MGLLRGFLLIWRAARRDYHRWQNKRARARRVVYTWPTVDQRDWQGEFERSIRP